jgi:hypothetical protein
VSAASDAVLERVERCADAAGGVGVAAEGGA